MGLIFVVLNAMETTVLNKFGDDWGKKWRLAVFFTLKDGPLRFSEIKEKIPACSVKVLSSTLKFMVDHRLIFRTQYESIPVKVTYHIPKNALGLLNGVELLYNVYTQYLIKNKDIHPNVYKKIAPKL